MTPFQRLIAALAFAAAISSQPAQAGIREATVCIYNRTPDGGINGASGTLVAIDPARDYAYGVTCAHAFAGRIDGHFTVMSHDGTKLDAQLKDWDRGLDLAVFVVPFRKSMDVIPIADCRPESDEYILAGYPLRGDSQRYETRKASMTKANLKDTQGRSVFEFNQSMGEGSSGGGAICDGMLVGVISAGEPKLNTTITCSQYYLYEFCNKPRKLCVNGSCRIFRLFPPPRRLKPIPANPPAPAAPLPADEGDPAPAPPPSVGVAGPAGKQGPQGPPGPRGPSGPAGAGSDPAKLTELESRIRSLEQMKIPVIVYDGAGKVKSRKIYRLGDPLEFKFSQVK